MENSNIYSDLIESYLDNSLTGGERKSFEEMIKTDPVLEEEYAERVKIQELWVEAARRDELKKHLKKLFDVEKEKEKKRHLNNWLIAATIIVLLGVSSLFYFQVIPNGKNQEFVNGGGKTTKDNTEEFTPSQESIIPKPGDLGSVDIKSANKNLFLPANGTVFTISDTIAFSWPTDLKPVNLVISDTNGANVKEFSLANKTEYRLAPSSLNPGSYKWSLKPDTTTYHFSMK